MADCFFLHYELNKNYGSDSTVLHFWRDLIAKGPKYREPCKVDWDKNLLLLCEFVDQYALQWAKRETVELSVLSS